MAERLEVHKTYKTYVGGAFPRSESGHYYKVFDKEGKLLANACRCTRKDFRDAVVIARKALKGWKSRSAYNRGQILYRIGEMLETRRAEFIDILKKTGYTPKNAENEINASIDRLIYYAGWTDKYQQVFGSINPVASAHFNFSMLEPTGVVSILAPEESPLLGLVSVIAPTIAGGNTCIVHASEAYPLASITLGEVLNSSDVPGGVVNILTGVREELIEHFASHMDVNAIFYTDALPNKQAVKIDELSAENMKRVIKTQVKDWDSDDGESPYFLIDLQETKTTWHPVGY